MNFQKTLNKLTGLAIPVSAPLLLASLALAQDGAPKTNVIADVFGNAGVIGWVIVVISIVSLALIIENFMTLKRDKIAPPDLIDELEALFDEENFQEALELCENERGYLTNVVAAGLGKLGHSDSPSPCSSNSV